MIQTNPIIQEQDFDDPLPLLTPDEPVHDCDGNRSQVSQPVEEQHYNLEIPVEESEEEPITDDWAKSDLFNVIKDLTNNMAPSALRTADLEA